MIPRADRRPSHVLRRKSDTVVVLFRGADEVASWPVGRAGRPALDLVDELARLQLAARRLGCEIRLRNPCPALCELVELAGLADVIMPAD